MNRQQPWQDRGNGDIRVHIPSNTGNLAIVKLNDSRPSLHKMVSFITLERLPDIRPAGIPPKDVEDSVGIRWMGRQTFGCR